MLKVLYLFLTTLLESLDPVLDLLDILRKHSRFLIDLRLERTFRDAFHLGVHRLRFQTFNTLPLLPLGFVLLIKIFHI